MLIKLLFHVLEFPCLKITQKAKHKGKSKECLLSFRNNTLFIEKPGRELFSGWKMLGWKMHGPIIPFAWKLKTCRPFMNGRAFFQVSFPFPFIKALIEPKFRTWLDTSNMHLNRFILNKMIFCPFQAAEGSILILMDLYKLHDYSKVTEKKKSFVVYNFFQFLNWKKNKIFSVKVRGSEASPMSLTFKRPKNARGLMTLETGSRNTTATVRGHFIEELKAFFLSSPKELFLVLWSGYTTQSQNCIWIFKAWWNNLRNSQYRPQKLISKTNHTVFPSSFPSL